MIHDLKLHNVHGLIQKGTHTKYKSEALDYTVPTFVFQLSCLLKVVLKALMHSDGTGLYNLNSTTSWLGLRVP